MGHSQGQGTRATRGPLDRRPTTAPPTPRARSSLARAGRVATVNSRRPGAYAVEESDAAPGPDSQTQTRCQGAKRACSRAGTGSSSDGLRAPLRRLIDFAASAPAPAPVGLLDPRPWRSPGPPPGVSSPGHPRELGCLGLTPTHPAASICPPARLPMHGRRVGRWPSPCPLPCRWRASGKVNANHARCPPSP